MERGTWGVAITDRRPHDLKVESPSMEPAGLRQIARDRGYDPMFSVARHLLKTGSVAAAICVLGGYLARDATTSTWAWLPVFWVVANMVEWAVHRHPMHRPMTPRLLYNNHTLIHHHAFKGDAQEIADARDLSMVMMPWYTLVLIFVGASPLFVLSGWVLGPDYLGVFLVGAVAYFALYEAIHTIHHLPFARVATLALLRRPLAWLRAHHHHHHQQERMAHVNFNVTVPLTDLLLGTYETPTRRLDTL